MVTLRDLKQLLELYDYPADAQEALMSVHVRILEQESLCRCMDEAERCLFDADAEREAYLAALEGVAQAVGAAQQTIPLLCMLQAAIALRERYRLAGIPDAIWQETVLDLRTKAMECKRLEGVYGLFGTGTPLWMVNYYRMQRFALGRLQYEVGQMKAEECTKASANTSESEH